MEENYVEEGQVTCREYYDYYVDWTGDSEYTNEAQKTYLSKEGNLYIVIADGTDIAKSILGMYTNRLCLAQYKNKTFKDSDFSTVKILG